MSSGPRRKSSAGDRNMMSVYPPRHIAAALGGYRSVPFGTALRIAAQALAEANLAASRKLSEREWAYVYEALLNRSVEPEMARPGGYLSEIVTASQTHFNRGKSLDPKNPGAAAEALAKKLSELDYLQAWAVMIACKWKEENEPDESGPEWWTIKYRAEKGA